MPSIANRIAAGGFGPMNPKMVVPPRRNNSRTHREKNS